MRRGKQMCGILTVLFVCFASGCGFMQAKNDTVLEPVGATAFERGLDYEEQQEFKLAAREYEKALEADPSDSRCWVNLGLIHANAGRHRHAVACWQKAIHANPGDARAYNLLGNVCRENKDYSKAIAYYQRAVQADPEYADPHWNMAAALRHQDMKTEAAEHYRRFVELSADAESLDVTNAKLFIAELDSKGFTDRPQDVDDARAVAEGEPPAEEKPVVTITVLDDDAAGILVGETIKFAHTDTGDARTEEPADEDVHGFDDFISGDADVKPPASPSEATDVETDKPSSDEKTARKETPDAKRARLAAELDRAVWEVHGQQAEAAK